MGKNEQLDLLKMNKERLCTTLSGVYGVVQKAAESAYRLQIQSPAYYSALYAHELEMMYFLVEPLLERAGAFTYSESETNIADIITRMIR